MSTWFVYMLRCGDGSLYTGITTNVDARVLVHNNGRGAAYTRSHHPVTLVWQEKQSSESIARKREAEIKRFKKQEKENMVYLSSNSKSKPITMAKGNNAQKKNTKKLKKPKK